MKALVSSLVYGSVVAYLVLVAEAGLLSLNQNASRVEQPLPEDPLGDCFEVPKSICLVGRAGGKHIVGKSRPPPDLVLWYQFDKRLPVDDSGQKHHLLDDKAAFTQLISGPGVLGRGASASFDGKYYRTVKSTSALQTPAFTIALWMYLQEDSVGSWRTIFHKGTGPDQLTPTLLLWPNERRLHVRVSTTADWNEGVLESSGLVPLRRWTHVAVTSTGSVVRLYVNGVKDGEVILEGEPAVNEGDLHIGRDPWRAGTKAYIDDFRWYSKELTEGDLRALTYPRLTGITSGSDVHLGCSSCTFAEAVKVCGERSHLCSLQELLSGGFHVARVVGWLAVTPEVWYHNEENVDPFGQTRKLGLCCREPAPLL